MDQRLLRQFVNLAEALHFGRASEASHISSSALSRNIRQLEDELGVALFDRDNRSVSLTHSGELFLDYARDALSQWDALRTTLMERAGELHGEVSIYCSVTASYSFLFELLSRFRDEYPHVEIKLHTGDPEDALQRVRSGAEDIAIGARPDVLSTDMAFKPVARTPLVFIAARSGDYRARLRGRAGAEAWRDMPMILSESGLSRRRVDEWFQGRNIQPNIYAQVAGNEAIVSMVSLGFGIGVVPKIVLDNSPLAETVEEIRVRPTLAPYEVGLLALTRRLRSPLISAFWSLQK